MEPAFKIEFEKLRRLRPTFNHQQQTIVPLNQQPIRLFPNQGTNQINVKQKEYEEFLGLAKNAKNFCWGILLPKFQTTNFGSVSLTNNQKKKTKKSQQSSTMPFYKDLVTKLLPKQKQRVRNDYHNPYQSMNNQNSALKKEDGFFKIGILLDGKYRYIISKAQFKDLSKHLNKQCQNWTYDLPGILRQFEVEEFPDFLKQTNDLKIACWLLDPEIKEWDLESLQKKYYRRHSPPILLKTQEQQQLQINLTNSQGQTSSTNQIRNFYYQKNANKFNYQQFGCDLSSSKIPGTITRMLNQSLFHKLQLCKEVMGNVVEQIEHKCLTKIYTNVETPLCYILSVMEHQGLLFDYNAAQRQMFVLSGLMGQLQTKIQMLVGPVNMNSPQQLAEIVYDKLKLVPRHYGHDKNGTKQLRSTKESILIRMVDDHPIVPLILEFRKKAKSFGCLKSLLTLYREHPKCQNSGKMYGMWSQINTATGRLTSENASLQNISIEHRRFFKAKGGHSLITADYSALELRIVTHLSGDQKLTRILSQSQVDPMKYVASLILKKDITQISPKDRADTKVLLYGTTYGMGPNKIAARMSLQTSQAVNLQKKLFVIFPDLCRFTSKIKKRLEKTKYAQTLFGRRRYLKFITDKDMQKKSKDQRIGVNTTIQGTSADLMRVAFISLYDSIQNCNLKDKLSIILQIHDEFVFQVHDDYIQEALLLIKKNLENIVNFSVPFPIKMKVGKDWGELEK
ncbi:DNA polymerase theta [Anaeramoeba flamelloides]|uniref:DNA polymerase theta n=1 Tax=Anaeramoeba flamelloides TaxID=1746091 RepID=A0AAV7ZNA0_9EUKA|nr:DNA polymerase theta [Anaeramoeba flamelloides]